MKLIRILFIISIHTGIPFLIVNNPLIASSTINFPGLTNIVNLSGAESFINIYSSYARAMGKHYGKALLLTGQETFPFGKDDMGTFPGFYAGIGLSTGFANINAIKSDSDPSVSSSLFPQILPGLGMTLNLGVALTENWDLRLTLFPPVSIALPSGATSGAFSGSYRMGNFKVRATRVLVKDSLFMPGVSLGMFIFYDSGSASISKTGLTASEVAYDGGVVTNFTYDVNADLSWKYGGFGTEIRAWWNLFAVYPYIGMALDFRSGNFTTAVNLNGNITVTGFGTESSTGTLGFEESVPATAFTTRLLFGFEFNLYLARIGVEIDIDLPERLIGAGIGAGTQF